MKFVNEKKNKETDFGWFGHPLFKENGQINSGKFTNILFKPPVPTFTPFDTNRR